jgi:hypothetical protein
LVRVPNVEPGDLVTREREGSTVLLARRQRKVSPNAPAYRWRPPRAICCPFGLMPYVSTERGSSDGRPKLPALGRVAQLDHQPRAGKVPLVQ